MWKNKMIRPSEPHDLDVMVRIWLTASIAAHDFVDASFWQSRANAMRHDYLPAAECYVYEQQGAAIGFYALYEQTLAALFVAPHHQGGGVGLALLNHAKQQRYELTLTVYQANQRSCAFYKKQGFSVIQAQIDGHTGHPELLMKHSR